MNEYITIGALSLTFLIAAVWVWREERRNKRRLEIMKRLSFTAIPEAPFTTKASGNIMKEN